MQKALPCAQGFVGPPLALPAVRALRRIAPLQGFVPQPEFCEARFYRPKPNSRRIIAERPLA